MSDITIVSPLKGRPPKPIKCQKCDDTEPENFYKNRPSECKKCFSKKSNKNYVKKGEYKKMLVEHIDPAREEITQFPKTLYEIIIKMNILVQQNITLNEKCDNLQNELNFIKKKLNLS